MEPMSFHEPHPHFPVGSHTGTAGIPLRQRLGLAVAQAWQRPFYRRHWGFASLENAVDAVHNGNFSAFPLVRKDHLRRHWDEVMDINDSSDLVSSSGTTGRPVDIPVHRHQETGRIERVSRLLRELGVGPGSKVLQLLSLNDLFTLGPLAWQAIKQVGACAIRCSPQRLDRMLSVIEYNRPDTVIANPFVMVRLAREAAERWPDSAVLPHKAFFAVAATFDKNLEQTLVAREAVGLWGIRKWLNQYGTSEVGPVGFECARHTGLHVHEDYHLVELIDPETGKHAEPGSPGEVVVSGLSFPRGFLPVRYATGDIAAWLVEGQCACGRSSKRLGPIIGRVDHQLKVFGQTVYPDLLLNLAEQSRGVKRSAVTVRRNPHSGDNVTLLLVPETEHDAEALRREVAERIARNLAVSPSVALTTHARLDELEQSVSSRTNGSKVPRFFELPSE